MGATDVAILVGLDVGVDDVVALALVVPATGVVIAGPVVDPDVTAGVVGPNVVADVTIDVGVPSDDVVEADPVGPNVVALVVEPDDGVPVVEDGAGDVIVGTVDAVANVGAVVADGSPKLVLGPCMVRSSLTFPLLKRAVPCTLIPPVKAASCCPSVKFDVTITN